MSGPADVIGQMAGLGTPQGKTPATPERLIEVFCRDVPSGLVADPGVESDSNVTVARGFCGYNGVRSEDPMQSGFDDGYVFMSELMDRGWAELPGKGDWPYVVYLAWRPIEESPLPALAEYCEGDLTIWQFSTFELAGAKYLSLRDCP